MTEYFLWFKAWHVISLVCWFAAIFYLPRLFVYHAMSADKISQDRFALMERKLYRGIMTPAMIATWIFGLCMLLPNWDSYKTQVWLHIKLVCVFWTSNHHIRHSSHKRDIKHPRMGRTVFTDQACTVNGKHHIQILQSHIVNQLVIATL